ncbi:MAG: hypothetical protein ACJ8J0_12565 [Longimicrobiaceae bacterium]
MSRTLRIAAVTGGLLVAGAIAGAIASVLAFIIAAAIDSPGPSLMTLEPLLFVGSLGALLGGVLLPITAWLFLRRVPIGLAVVGTLLGTVVGGALGWILFSGSDQIRAGLAGAFAGFALSALLLRLLASAPRVPRAISTRG